MSETTPQAGGLALKMKMQETLDGLQEMATQAGWGSDTSTFEIIEIIPPTPDHQAPEDVAPVKKPVTLIAARKCNAA